jgi:hypothetical protein
MRADMAKVLVERPRLGARLGPVKGYRKRERKQLVDEDGGPVREAMQRRSGRTKCFNEHLGPLRRFLDAQVGRPWNAVYSEICAHIDRGNVVQKHILTHLFEYVITTVVLIDGVPCHGEGRQYGTPIRDSYRRYLWYVCPQSGLLKRAHRRRRLEAQNRRQAQVFPPPSAAIRINKSLRCIRFAHGWELVMVAPLPEKPYPGDMHAMDVVLNKSVLTVTAFEAERLYGSAVYAVSRRRLRKTELRQYPIPIDLIR